MPCSQADYSFLRHLLSSRSDNIVDPSRNDLFDARLYRVARSRGMNGLDDLVARLKMSSDPLLTQEVVEAMTINETSFFRDRSPFDLLKDKLLPSLIENRSQQQTLRLWSAACSTGQEAYSLAMLLRQHFPQLAQWKIEIVGTDINAEMVRRARSGRFQRMEVNRGLPARFLLQYFVRDEEEWKAISELRSMCSFHQRNLSHAFPVLEKYDGILMRNVLFYFSEATRRLILRRIHSALCADGFLLLGASEQAGLHDLWQPVVDGSACYYKPRI